MVAIQTYGCQRWTLIPETETSLHNSDNFHFTYPRCVNLPGYPSVPMTLNDVIVHVRQFIIALVSVDGCSSFPDPDDFLDVPDSSVGFLVYNVHSLPVYDVVFSCRMVCKGGFIDGRHQSFFYAPCVFLFFRVVYILSVFLQSCFSSLPVSPMYSAPQFLHGIWYTSSPCYLI